jgi:hypothetical protein
MVMNSLLAAQSGDRIDMHSAAGRKPDCTDTNGDEQAAYH